MERRFLHNKNKKGILMSAISIIFILLTIFWVYEFVINIFFWIGEEEDRVFPWNGILIIGCHGIITFFLFIYL